MEHWPIVLLSVVLLSSFCYSQLPDLSDPCGSAATQAHSGDIAYLVPNFTQDMDENTTEDEGSRERRAATSRTNRVWPGGIVYYTFSSAFTDAEERLIYEAMMHWEDNTCIRFRRRTNQRDYVNFFPGSGCCSYVGRIGWGLQGISIARNCMYFPTIVHEIGHAIGFWHEQSRPDRDQYIDILYENVQPGFESNFRKINPSEVNSQGIGYDYNSIMHYSSRAFSLGYRITIRAKDRNIPVGMAVELSQLDIMQANRLYNCDQNNLPSPEITLPPAPPTSSPTPPTNPFPCGQVFLNASGSFQSPGYPTHRRNQNCAWIIQGPEGYRLRIEFEPIIIESSHQCTKDYIEVFGSLDSSGTSYGRRCGTYYSYTVTTQSNKAFVRFHSDGSDYRQSSLRGFSASFTVIDIDECYSSNGYCAHYCHNIPGAHVCSCRNGFFLSGNGRTCFDVNECALNNGGCQHRCLNWAGSYFCLCNTDYILQADQRSCVHHSLICSNNNGRCHQICTDFPTGRVCSCHDGYRLVTDLTGVCSDIDECIEHVANCEQLCLNTLGSFSCACRAGYRLRGDRVTCQNVDECAVGIHRCSQLCIDTEGSYECACREGFRLSLDRRQCVDVNECAEGGHRCSHTCFNLPGSYACSCPEGLQLTNDSHTCEDVNECDVELHQCDVNSSATCVNTVGSYMCTCPLGYQLDGNRHSCVDVDECASGVHNCSGPCQNTEGSYWCGCPQGFQANGTLCEDVDECASGVHNCSGPCQNIEGSYWCGCPQGFQANGMICEDIDECASGVHNCSGPCQNIEGSYWCGCPQGFQANGMICEDTNECYDDDGGCDGVCVNTVGSYHCQCEEGLVLDGDGHSCRVAFLSRCSPGTHGCTPTRCSLHGAGCRCKKGYQLGRTYRFCHDVDECAVNNGGCNQTCINSRGSYACYCLNGYQQQGSSCIVRRCNSFNGGCNHICFYDILGIARCKCRPGYVSERDYDRRCYAPDDPFRPEAATCGLPCEDHCVQEGDIFHCECSGDRQLQSDGISCANETQPTIRPPEPNTEAPVELCNGTIVMTEESGTIQSPGWPNYYPTHLSCEWRIELPDPTKVIQFTFSSRYGLAGKPPCRKDWVEVFNGEHEEAISMGRFCYKSAPTSSMTSSTNQARVVFRAGSNHYPTRKGFRLQYQSLNRPQGTFYNL